MATKTVVIYSTQGNSSDEFVTSSATWGDLKAEMNTKGIHHDDMDAIIGETETNLVSSKAMLPDDNFTVFLVPRKVKSGIVDEVFGETADDFDVECDDIKDFSFTSISEQMKGRIKLIEYYQNLVKEQIDGLTEDLDSYRPSTPDGGLSSRAAEIIRNLKKN